MHKRAAVWTGDGCGAWFPRIVDCIKNSLRRNWPFSHNIFQNSRAISANTYKDYRLSVAQTLRKNTRAKHGLTCDHPYCGGWDFLRVGLHHPMFPCWFLFCLASIGTEYEGHTGHTNGDQMRTNHNTGQEPWLLNTPWSWTLQMRKRRLTPHFEDLRCTFALRGAAPQTSQSNKPSAPRAGETSVACCLFFRSMVASPNLPPFPPQYTDMSNMQSVSYLSIYPVDSLNLWWFLWSIQVAIFRET